MGKEKEAAKTDNQTESQPETNVVTTKDGLKIETTQKGSDEKKVAEPGKKVTVNYTGWVEEDKKRGKKDNVFLNQILHLFYLFDYCFVKVILYYP